mgnify:CR=1 FL=1
MRDILDKIEKTVALIATPLAGVLMVWTGVDYAIYTEATAGLVISVCEYIKLFDKTK